MDIHKEKRLNVSQQSPPPPARKRTNLWEIKRSKGNQLFNFKD